MKNGVRLVRRNRTVQTDCTPSTVQQPPPNAPPRRSIMLRKVYPDRHCMSERKIDISHNVGDT